jgi:hypothetical protein
LTLGWVVFGLTVAAWGMEPANEFLEALQKKGYGEAGVDYLEMLKAQGKVPPEIQENWDWQMSKCLSLSVKEAFNKGEAEERKARAEQLREKFIKEHPDSPLLSQVLETAGNDAFERAMQFLAEGKLAKDKDQAAAEKLMEDARKAFAESRPGFVKSVEGYKETYEKLKNNPGKNKGKKAQEAEAEALGEAQFNWLDGRMKVAMVDYYLAQTYLDPKAAKAKESLKSCSKELDAIYQENRGTLIGVYAHLWTGKIEDELGHEDLALDIYDEVGAGEDSENRKKTGLEDLYAQAANFRMQIKLRKQGAGPFLEEAEEWLKQWEGLPDSEVKKAYRNTDGYQAIALQVVKRQLEMADKATGAEKSKLADPARKRLLALAKAKVKGESLAEILQLSRTVASKGASADAPLNPGEIKTFEDAMTLAEDAYKSGGYEQAELLYNRALELTEKVKDKQRITDAHTGLENASYAIAIKLYQAGKMSECFDVASKIANKKGNEASVVAPKAAALCVQALVAQFATLQDPAEKEAMQNRIKKVADFVLSRWPDRAEADDVRISVARSELVRGNFQEAMDKLEEVNPRSERRPLADQLAGQLHWRNYAIEKAKPEAERDNKLIDAERTKAEEQLANSLEAQRKTVGKDEEWPSQLVETELLLGELRFDKGEFKEAAELFQPLVDHYIKHKPQNLDKNVLRSFILAVRACNGLGDFTKSGQVAAALIDLGDTDTPEVNSVSVNFVRLLAEEYKLVDLQLLESKANGIPKESTQLKLAGLKENLTKLLGKLATKQNHSLAGLIFMGDTSARIGDTPIAEELYKRALDQAEKEKAANPGAAAGGNTALAAIPRIQAQVVGLMLQKKQFEEGIKLIDKLIAEQPRALEPKMVKGRLLQGWAEQAPAHFKEAEAHWTELRNMLNKMAKKPPEYFECNYNVALCLVKQAEDNKDPAKAKTARQLLHTMMSKSPKLSGPEMVARYNMLLEKAGKLVGEEEASANGKAIKPAPVK